MIEIPRYWNTNLYLTRRLQLNPQLSVIDTEEGLITLSKYLEDKEFVAFDLETTGVHKSAEIIGFSICAEEDLAYYVVLSKWEKDKLVSTNINNLAKDFMTSLSTHKLVCHNGIFDCMMVSNYFKVSLIDSLHTDTMILAHLLNENRRVGLKELAKEYFGEDATIEQKEMKESVIANGGKLTKTAYEMYKADWKLMAKYGAKDALLTYKLFLELVPELYAQNLDKFFYEDESMPLLRGPTYDLNSTGLKVDIKELLTLKKNLEAECAEAKSFVYQEVKELIKEKYPGTNKKSEFNMCSNQQLSWLLFGKIGLEFNTLTKAGKNVCKDKLGIKVPYTFNAKKQFIFECESSANKKIQNPYTQNPCHTRAGCAWVTSHFRPCRPTARVRAG